MRPFSSLATVLVLFATTADIRSSHADTSPVETIGNHAAVYDGHGYLKPWTSWKDALNREMKWYSHCPMDGPYPRFVRLTFMDGNYKWLENRPDTIPAMQDGLGILSYLKYYAYRGSRDKIYLDTARQMGNFLVKECLTPNEGKYPRFTRSTGHVGPLPFPADCGSQDDHPYEIEPDKGGIAGYALLALYDATHDQAYLDQALQNARVLTANMRDGCDSQSPWPFRADYRTGAARGEISANMSYILRLLDGLIDHGYFEFSTPREKLWQWIKTYQIPSAGMNGDLWVQFFEDYDLVNNRNSWSPLNLARYLVEKQDKLDPKWKQDAKTLIEFAVKNFTGFRNGIPICGEQDDDRKPWGGALSNYGAVLAMYSAATGSNEYKGLAYMALTYGLYAIDNDGCPGQSAVAKGRGGWQEDAHTDRIHNYMDALKAFPAWAK